MGGCGCRVLHGLLAGDEKGVGRKEGKGLPRLRALIRRLMDCAWELLGELPGEQPGQLLGKVPWEPVRAYWALRRSTVPAMIIVLIDMAKLLMGG